MSAWRLFFGKKLNEGFLGTGGWCKGNGVLGCVDFREQVTGDVLGSGFLDSWWADEHGVEVWLDVANYAHVFPEVGTAASGKNGESRPGVELVWSFVARGIGLVGGEEVHSEGKAKVIQSIVVIMLLLGCGSWMNSTHMPSPALKILPKTE